MDYVRTQRAFTGLIPLAVATVALMSACSPGVAPDERATSTPSPAVAAVSPALGDTGSAAAVLSRRVVPGEFLVKFSSRVSKEGALGALRKASFGSKRGFSTVPGLYLVAGNPSQDAVMLKQTLRSSADVEYVEPNFVYRASAVPNDPDYVLRQWPLNNTGQTGGGSSQYFPDIQAEDAWDITTGADDLVVAVIDSGVDYTHEDLRANIFRNEAECDADGVDDDANGHVDDCHGIDTTAGDSDPMDGEEHGTHVAGIIAAVGNNGVGIAGVSWRAKLLPCRFLDSQGEGTAAGAIACLDYIASMKDRGVNIIASNNSWGNFEESRALEDAIRAQRQRGILFVAAAGNDLHDVEIFPEYPCAYDLSNVICVASSYEGLSQFSNYGIGAVHLAAPGDSIYSTLPGNRYGHKDGTSMAAPHVSGALVLLQSQDRARDWRAIRNLVLAGAAPSREHGIPTVTNGRLDLLRSMNCADSAVLARLRPATFEQLHRPVGGIVRIRALHIRCAMPNGNVVVSVSPSGELVTLRDDGGGEDDSAGDGVYSGSWIAQVPGDFTFSFPAPETETFRVRVDEQLEAGYPLSADARSFADEMFGVLKGEVAVGNIDADPELEIVSLVPDFGPLHAWDADANPVAGWPIYHDREVLGMSLGELDGNRQSLEIAAIYSLSGAYLLRGDGSEIRRIPELQLGAVAPTLVVVDIDGDGVDELLGGPARRADGTLFRSDVPVPRLPQGEEGGSNGVVAGDLDADGVMEFATASERNNVDSLWISNAAGNRDGFPVVIPGDSNPVGYTYPVIGDVDGDGQPEVLLGSVAHSGHFNPGQVQIFNRRGQLKRTINSNSQGGGLPSLADVDGDGIPEIVMATRSQVFVWRGNGESLPGWPVTLQAPTWLTDEHPAAGDVDGDGRVDIVLTGGDESGSKLALFAFRHDGSQITGFPKSVDSDFGGSHPVNIADIDLDGRNEIVVAHVPGLGLRQSIYVYDLHGPGPYGPVEWSGKLGSSRRQGYYETGKNLPNHAYVATQKFGGGSVRSADGGIDCGSSCLHRYAKGTNVVLTAYPAAGSTFSTWRGACAGQGNPCTLAVSRFNETSADFLSPFNVSILGAGTVSADRPGISCPGDCVETFPARAYVTLTAAPAPGNSFQNWEGACSGTQPTCSVFVDEAENVTAKFTDRHTLTVVQGGTGSARYQTNPAGIDCVNGCSGEFTPGSIVTLMITPDANTFVENIVYPGCFQLQTACPVTMNGVQSVHVQLGRRPQATVNITGSGSIRSQPAGIDCSTNCSRPIGPGQVEFRAEVAPGWRFVRWEGYCSTRALGPVCSFHMTTDQEITAIFERNPYLALDFQGTGTGSVSGASGLSCATDCEVMLVPPQVISLTATPGANSVFGGWSGACSGTAVTCQVPFAATTTVGVTFNIAPPPPPPPPPPPTGGSSSGGGGGGRIGLGELLALGALLGVIRRSSRRSAKCRASACSCP